MPFAYHFNIIMCITMQHILGIPFEINLFIKSVLGGKNSITNTGDWKNMIIGVTSDTHIPSRAKKIPKKIIEDFNDVDMILHLGDFQNIEVLRELQNLGDVRAVYGNMDPYDIRKELPEKDLLHIGGYKIGLIHGSGAPWGLEKRIRRQFPEDIDVIVYGHSHKPLNEVRDGVLFFNPGTPTDKVFASVNTYGILEVEEGKINGRIVKV